jgi:hypothetical protein
LDTKEAASEAELTNARGQTASTLLQNLATLRWQCSYFTKTDEAHVAGCPGKTMVDRGLADPWLKSRIAELETELQAVRTQKLALRSDLEAAQRESVKRRKAFSRQTAEQVRIRGDITRQIGAWEARKNEAERYCAAWRDLGAIESGRDARQKKIDNSAEALAAARTRFEKQKGQLSAHYDAVLKMTISPEAEGKIEIDGDGIRPQSNAIVADSGMTLRQYADVLSFDLSCLAASVCGVGHLPRLWIHDSPRQADSEEQLYHSVLRFLADLESRFAPGHRPSFQYILTTTSAPPQEVNRPPYVRVRLHARTEQGKLLKRDFGK